MPNRIHKSNAGVRAGSASLLALAVVLAVPAAAQTAPVEDGPADGEIVVTALKREQALIDVPAAITALDSSSIEDRQIRSLTDIQAQSPNVNFGTSVGTAQVSIRGVGLTINAPWGEPGVAVHLDGVYEARPALSQLATFDLERIEILRGPQGTLYGRNATGGAVNFISKAPTDSFEGYVRVGYGNFNEGRGELVASGPVSDTVRARFGVTYTKRADGFLRNVRADQRDADLAENIGVRGRVAIDLSEEATLDLGLTYLRSTGSQPYITALGPISPTVAAVNPAYNGALAPLGGKLTATDSQSLDRRAFSPTATLKWDFGDIALSSISAYTDIDTLSTNDGDGTSAPIADLFNGFTSKAFTQEFNLTGTTGALEWITGLYYLNEKFNGRSDLTSPTGWNLPADFGGGLFGIPVYSPGGTTIQQGREKRKSYAGFADVTFKVSDQLSFFAGGRYSRDEIATRQTTAPNFPDSGYSCLDTLTSVDFEAFTPRGGVKLDLGRSNFYASVSKGYKAGGVNPGSCGNSFKPEKLLAYEIGYKGRPFDGVTIALSGFHYDYTDYQVYLQRPITQGGGTIIANAPKARTWGGEAELDVSLVQGLRFNGSLGYLDAKFVEYENADPLVDPFGLNRLNLKGYRIPRSAKWTAGGGLEYETAVGGDWSAKLRGEAYYTSSVYFTEFNKAIDKQKGYTLLNAFLEVGPDNDSYSIRLFGKNLADKQYVTFMTPNPLFGGNAGTYGPRRQYGVEFTANF